MSSKKPSNKNTKNNFVFKNTFGVIENEEGDYCNVELPFNEDLAFDLCINNVDITFDNYEEFLSFCQKIKQIQDVLSKF